MDVTDSLRCILSVYDGSGRFLMRRQWIVSGWQYSHTHTHTHTVWQSFTHALKHRLRLNVQWMQYLLISSVVRDYKYRLINKNFPAVGNILSTGTELRLNFWGLREMMGLGLSFWSLAPIRTLNMGPKDLICHINGIPVSHKPDRK